MRLLARSPQEPGGEDKCGDGILAMDSRWGGPPAATPVAQSARHDVQRLCAGRCMSAEPTQLNLPTLRPTETPLSSMCSCPPKTRMDFQPRHVGRGWGLHCMARREARPSRSLLRLHSAAHEGPHESQAAARTHLAVTGPNQPQLPICAPHDSPRTDNNSEAGPQPRWVLLTHSPGTGRWPMARSSFPAPQGPE